MEKLLDLISIVFSLALYVAQALGLHTIARRRGIRHAWLAWLPVGNVWILASISDDHRRRKGGRMARMRRLLLILVPVYVVSLILTVTGLSFTLSATLGQVLTEEEMLQYFTSQYISEDDLYASADKAAVEAIEEKLMESLTEDQALLMTVGSLACAGFVMIVVLPLSLATTGLQYWCIYNLFDSCVPERRFLYFAISVLLGVQGFLIFSCRHSDRGITDSNIIDSY